MAPRADELAFITDPDQWPSWPVLPVVKRQGAYDPDGAGFLIDSGKPIVYLDNIFNLKAGTIADITKNLEKIEYPDFDGLLDVWRID